MRSLVLSTAIAIGALLAGPGQAETATIGVSDAYVRSSSPSAASGAAFMTLVNSGSEDDRLIGVATEAAERAELHTHVENAAGVMRMVEVEDGFAVPAGGTHMLQRGGDHVMLMGFAAPLDDGDSVTMTLIFEGAGEIEVEIPVDNARMPHGHGG